MNARDRLARLANHRTAYEVVATFSPSGPSTGPEQRILVGYARSKGARALRDLMRLYGPELVKLTGAETFEPIGRTLKLGSWVLAFTGRTQRQAISEGELPRVSERTS